MRLEKLAGALIFAFSISTTNLLVSQKPVWSIPSEEEIIQKNVNKFAQKGLKIANYYADYAESVGWTKEQADGLYDYCLYIMTEGSDTVGNSLLPKGNSVERAAILWSDQYVAKGVRELTNGARRTRKLSRNANDHSSSLKQGLPKMNRDKAVELMNDARSAVLEYYSEMFDDMRIYGYME